MWYREYFFTWGRKCFITVIWPYILTSLRGLRPSGVTKSISNWLLRAIIKFKSVGEVKLPAKIQSQKIRQPIRKRTITIVIMVSYVLFMQIY